MNTGRLPPGRPGPGSSGVTLVGVSAPDEDGQEGTDEPVERFFPYEFEERYRLVWRFSGANPDVDGVHLTADRLVATYGRKKVDTPRTNVTGAHITRDYSWTKAIGIRGSLKDDGLTFGTCTRGGVCIHFAERIPKVIGFRPHSALTVTVEDLEGLVDALGPAEPR